MRNHLHKTTNGRTLSVLLAVVFALTATLFTPASARAATAQSSLTATSGRGSGRALVYPTTPAGGYFRAEMTVSIQGAAPDTTFALQRAPDFTADGACSGTAYRPFGVSVTTNDAGNGAVHWHYQAPSTPEFASGRQFDVAFQAVGSDGSVLQGQCMTISITATPRGATIWVTNRDSNDVTVFDAASGAVLATIPVGREPIGIISPKGTNRIYVTNEAGNSVSVLDARTFEVLTTIPTGPRPHHVAASRDGRSVYFGEFGTNKVGVIDTRSNTLVAEYTAGPAEARTHAVAVTPDGKTLLATNDATNTLAALDAASGELLWSLPLGSFPYEVVPDPSGRAAYVSLRRGNKVVAVELATQKVYGESSVGTEPVTLQLAPSGKQLVVALRTNPAALGLMDTATGATERIGLPGPAGHNWLAPNGQTSYVAVEGRNPGVAVVHHATRQVTLYQDPGGGRPHGVFFLPAES
jgi:YVTN family beta-propeller protein